MNLIKRISNWLFGNTDSLNEECSKVYDKLEEKYKSKEKITDNHLTKEEYLSSLSTEKKQILVDSVDQIESQIDKDQWKTYLRQSKKVEEETKIIDPSVDTNQPDAAEQYVSKSLLVKGVDKPIELDDSRIVNTGHLKHTLTVEKGIITDVKSEITDDQLIIVPKPIEINTEKAKTIKQNKKRKYNKKK